MDRLRKNEVVIRYIQLQIRVIVPNLPYSVEPMDVYHLNGMMGVRRLGKCNGILSANEFR